MDESRRKEMEDRRDDLLRLLLAAPPVAGRKGRKADARSLRADRGEAAHSDPDDASPGG